MDLPFGLSLRLLEVDEDGKSLRREKLPVDKRVVAPLVLAADEPVLGLRALACCDFFGRVCSHDHLEAARAEHEPDARGLDSQEERQHGREQESGDLGREGVPHKRHVGEGRGGVESEPDGRDAVRGCRDDGREGPGWLLGGLGEEFELEWRLREREKKRGQRKSDASSLHWRLNSFPLQSFSLSFAPFIFFCLSAHSAYQRSRRRGRVPARRSAARGLQTRAQRLFRRRRGIDDDRRGAAADRPRGNGARSSPARRRARRAAGRKNHASLHGDTLI